MCFLCTVIFFSFSSCLLLLLLLFFCTRQIKIEKAKAFTIDGTVSIFLVVMLFCVLFLNINVRRSFASTVAAFFMFLQSIKVTFKIVYNITIYRLRFCLSLLSVHCTYPLSKFKRMPRVCCNSILK